MAAVDERRDEELEELYRRYAGDVQRYARVLSASTADAEDVTQQTFVNAFRALRRGRRPRKPLHWLIAIAHNVHRERLRQSSRRPAEVELDEGVAVVAREDAEWSPEEIREALERLGSKQRAAIVLRELEGRSYGEIAGVLGLSKPATEALAFRARRALREQLEGTLTCDDARAAVHRRLEGGLSEPEQGALRAHLRECRACAGNARSERGRRRRRLGGLAALPLPLPWLEGLFGGGGASAGSGAAAKLAVAAAASIVATGVGYDGVRQATRHASPAPRAARAAAVPTTESKARLVPARPRTSSTLPATHRRPSQSAARVAPRPVATKGRQGQAAARPSIHPSAERHTAPAAAAPAVDIVRHEDQTPEPAPPTASSERVHGERPASAHGRGVGPPRDHPSARGDDQEALSAADANGQQGQGNGGRGQGDGGQAAPPDAQNDGGGGD